MSDLEFFTSIPMREKYFSLVFLFFPFHVATVDKWQRRMKFDMQWSMVLAN